MKDIYYSTENEKKLIVAAQKKLNIDANGIIGMNTLSTLFFKAGVKLEEPVIYLRLIRGPESKHIKILCPAASLFPEQQRHAAYSLTPVITSVKQLVMLI